MMTLAKRKCAIYNLKGFHLLGDPAIRPVAPSFPLNVTATATDAHVSFTCLSEISFKGMYRLTVAMPDTIKLLDDTLRYFVKDSILIQKEDQFVNQFQYAFDPTISGEIHLIASVWNTNFQTNFDTTIFSIALRY